MTTPPLDYYPSLLNHARSLVSDQDAEDIVQEIYLRLVRRDPAVTVAHFHLHRAVHQVWISAWRKSQTVPTVPVGEIFDDSVPAVPDVAEAVVSAAFTEWVLSQVSEMDAEILRLRLLEDMSPTAVSEKLGIPVLSVGRRLSEAKRRLRLSKEKFTGVGA